MTRRTGTERARPAFVLVWFLLCAGCSSTPVAPAVLEDGQSLWRRVETEHFVVESNLASESRVLRIASEFETLWHAFASVPILGLRPPSVKPIVVVLRHEDEYRYVFGDQSAGVFVQETLLGPLIVLPPNCRAFDQSVIKHELAHFVASGSLANAPKWLGEGLAQVMETASYDTGAGRILFGSHSAGLVYGASFALPAEHFTGPWPAELTTKGLSAYYGRSWLLVHFLIDTELQGFLDFFVRLRNGEEWQSAWDREILLPREGIDGPLDHYYHRAKYGLWTVEAHLPDMDAFQRSSVSPADALALRSALHASAQQLEAASSDLATAQGLDPTSERVRAITAALAAVRQQPTESTDAAPSLARSSRRAP